MFLPWSESSSYTMREVVAQFGEGTQAEDGHIKLDLNNAGIGTRVSTDTIAGLDLPERNGLLPKEASEGWQTVFAELQRQDHKMQREYQEQIDTMLVFAGLFSAVLTAFVIESYPSLQPNSPTQIPRSVIRVNTVWFLSLVLSLVSALFGILIKGWIRAYMSWTEVSPPKEAVGLRQFRYEGLVAWQLPTVLAVLPGLLQAALVLFLCGLIDFLGQLNTTVATIVGAVTAASLVAAASTAVIPVFSRTAPFRWPLATVLLRVRSLCVALALRGYLHLVRTKRIPLTFRTAIRFLRPVEYWRHTSWNELDLRGVHAQDAVGEHATGCDACVRAAQHVFASSQADATLRAVRPCLYEGAGGGRPGPPHLPLVNCWPIASAALGFHGAGLSRAVRALETPASRAYAAGLVAAVEALPSASSPAGAAVYMRASSLAPASRRRLAGLLLDATQDGAGSLDSMLLLPALVEGDEGLIRRYVLVLARLIGTNAPGKPRDVAATQIQVAVGHLTEEATNWEEHEVYILLRTAVVVHRRNRALPVYAQLSLFSVLWEVALSAAAHTPVVLHSMAGRALLRRLLRSIDEDVEQLSIVGRPRPSVITLRCWRAIDRLAQVDLTIFPTSLFERLCECIGTAPGSASKTDWLRFLHKLRLYLEAYIM